MRWSFLRCLAASGFALALATAPSGAQSKSGAAVQGAAGEATLTVGGLLQVQFESGDRGDSRFPNGNDRFLLRRARLNATGTFKEDFDFRLELDLAGSLASASGLRAQLTDGYVNWNHYRFANVRAGQFKTPFGFEQLYGDPRLLTIERSLVNDRLTLGRQLGAQVGGDLLDKRVSYAAGAFNGSGVNTSANDNDSLLSAGRLAVVPWKGRIAGRTGSWGVGGNAFRSSDTAVSLPDLNFDSTPATADKDNLFTGTRHGFGADSQFEAGPLSLWVEYLRVRFEPANGRPAPAFDAGGWYVQGACFVLPERLQVVAKYETFDPWREAPGDAVSTDTAGLNYYVKGHDLKLMLDYLRTDLGPRSPRQNKLLLRLQALF
jgi:phosphate-selective porin OprO and OprP